MKEYQYIRLYTSTTFKKKYINDYEIIKKAL